jgi:divalent metal cation (Fe/Co/Zn/Cd) transporter
MLLIVVAILLGHANLSLLIGRSLPPRFRAAVRAEHEAGEEITAVQDLLTLQLGPTSVLIAARVDFRDNASGEAIERTCREAEARLRERYPTIQYVFLNPWGRRPLSTTRLGPHAPMTSWAFSR